MVGADILAAFDTASRPLCPLDLSNVFLDGSKPNTTNRAPLPVKCETVSESTTRPMPHSEADEATRFVAIPLAQDIALATSCAHATTLAHWIREREEPFEGKTVQ